VAAVVALTVGSASAAILNFSATIDGLQETPPNASPATGTATLIMDTTANTLSYTINYGGLLAPETAAHIHGFAAPGVPAGILHPLPAANPKIGVWNFTEAQEASIIGGLTYVNIHTSLFPGGEIRGQILQDVVGVAPATMSAIRNLYR
jgi:hypothetical protein